jgi:hypothetical protein
MIDCLNFSYMLVLISCCFARLCNKAIKLSHKTYITFRMTINLMDNIYYIRKRSET